MALLGDSIFDNAAYTSGAPDVVTHLRALLPAGWGATLCAVDGATCRTLRAQLPHVPGDATHAVVAVGGNDALQNLDLLSRPVRSTGEALDIFRARLDAFERTDREALDPVLALRCRVILCTVYNGALAPAQAPLARVGLMLFNDVICRAAFDHRLGLIELRAVCSEPSDYANPIEPSGPGGLKIARAVAHAAGALPAPFAQVWTA